MADLKDNVSNTSARSGQDLSAPGQGRSGSTTAGESGSVTGAATAAAKSFYDQAKETAGQAYEAVTDKAANTLDDKKTTLSDGLSAMADSLRKVGDNMGQGPASENALADAARRYGSTAAEKIQDLAQYFEKKDVRTMARDLENYARRNPAIFIGAAFGLGMLAARFLKSSAPNRGFYGDSGRDVDRSQRNLISGSSLGREEESGQGLQMGGQSFEPTSTSAAGRAGTTGTSSGTAGQNLGGTTAGKTGATPPSTTGGTSKKKTGGTSAKDTGSTRDSLGNPM